ncbi:hypothetical protein ACFSKU_19960 [Pontibacter silvestris]|uniref:Uncharacterized protein n=1 Tax=Pontibacter silvestris TaxID=2305183 RepID=A0ABW4X2H3_9BACT|nr:hypothetical protein [Pontibacter silvestris]MCC9134841.1 hypothetical protein [Pontibacter silvestris]
MKQLVLNDSELVRLRTAVKSMFEKLQEDKNEVELQLYNSLLFKLNSEDYLKEESHHISSTSIFAEDDEEGFDYFWDDEHEEDFDEEYDNRFNK